MVTRDEILDALSARWTLTPVPGRGGAPAERWMLDGGPAHGRRDRLGHGAVLRRLRPPAPDRRRPAAQLPLLDDRVRPAARAARRVPSRRADSPIDRMLRSCVRGKLPGHAINDPVVPAAGARHERHRRLTWARDHRSGEPVVKITVGARGRGADASDTLAVEEPLEIRVGGTPLAVTMRTPGNDVELAAGLPRVGGRDLARRALPLRDPLRRPGHGRPCGSPRRRASACSTRQRQHLQRARRHPRAGRRAARPRSRPQLLHDELVRALRQGVDRGGRDGVGVRRRGATT